LQDAERRAREVGIEETQTYHDWRLEQEKSHAEQLAELEQRKAEQTVGSSAWTLATMREQLQQFAGIAGQSWMNFWAAMVRGMKASDVMSGFISMLAQMAAASSAFYIGQGVGAIAFGNAAQGAAMVAAGLALGVIAGTLFGVAGKISASKTSMSSSRGSVQGDSSWQQQGDRFKEPEKGTVNIFIDSSGALATDDAVAQRVGEAWRRARQLGYA
jgi:hypothetical protein